MPVVTAVVMPVVEEVVAASSRAAAAMDAGMAAQVTAAQVTAAQVAVMAIVQVVVITVVVITAVVITVGALAVRVAWGATTPVGNRRKHAHGPLRISKPWASILRFLGNSKSTGCWSLSMRVL